MRSEAKSRIPRLRRTSVVSCQPTDLAPQERLRLYRGLERFVNAGDSPEEYRSFAKGWASFWPLDLQDGTTNLEWTDACHLLFRAYRDALRRVWISDPVALQGGVLSFLLGLSDMRICLPGELGLAHRRALDRIEIVHPGGTEISRPVTYPHWKSGNFTYSPTNDFQRAMYLLFRESWRAKVCAKCSTYFV